MSINKIIKDNYKINESVVDKEIEIKKDINDKDNDNSFKQLLNLQLLIQKHSGLKELCKSIIFINYYTIISYKRKR